MPKMIHPGTGKTVEVPESKVERNLARGFVMKTKEPEPQMEESHDDDSDNIEEEV